MNKWNKFFERLKEELETEYDTIIESMNIGWEQSLPIDISNDYTYTMNIKSYPVIDISLIFTGEMSKYTIEHLNYIFSCEPIKCEHEISFTNTYTTVKLSYNLEWRVKT